MAAAAQNSSAKSRSDTASMLFGVAVRKPSAWASACRSIGTVVPASAAAPSGHTSRRRRASANRSRSRASMNTYARRWWASSTGCARCRWVYPGIGLVRWRSACSTSAACTSRSARRIASISDRSQSRMSSAIWSFRERPVWSFPPTAPTFSIRRRSMFMWMSSSSIR